MNKAGVATNQNPEAMVGEGRFRGDLLYRMNAVTLRIPPLRDRGSDKLLLAKFFLDRFNTEFRRGLRGFTESAHTAIANHAWPGNVREMENRLKRAVVMAESNLVDAADLELQAADDIVMDLDLRAARARAERDVMRIALLRAKGNLSGTAKLLGVSRPTLYALMQAHGMDVEAGVATATAGSDPA